VALLLTAAAVVADGLLGPQIAPGNLATVLTWVHYRGLLVVALLGAGNLFCTACPMVLARDAGRRFWSPTRHFPTWLRTKWVPIGLFVLVLFAYELFDLWSLPSATAYLVLGYFGAAMIVDLSYSGASFCKYVCPIGQFSFVASTVSPLEVRVKEAGVCAACTTFDCIKGSRPLVSALRAEDGAGPGRLQRGCELRLFLPAKVGNMDCTLCLDCVHACPHDNVAIVARVPAAELVDTSRRSGIGRFTQRVDIAALVVVFVFGGLLNAFGMVAPAATVEHALHGLGITTQPMTLAIVFVIGLMVMPLAIVGTASLATRWITRDASSVRASAVRYAYALIPFGFAFWLAHYGFHLLTGALTVVPVTQDVVARLLGWAAFGEPLWQWTGVRAGAVYSLQIGVILLGTVGSIAIAHAMASHDHPRRASTVTLPWAAAIILLASLGVWIISQPMEMRGMVMPG
jgi:ferredoxin